MMKLLFQKDFWLNKLSLSNTEGNVLVWIVGVLFLYFLYKIPFPFDVILATVVGFIGLAFYTIDALAPEEEKDKQQELLLNGKKTESLFLALGNHFSHDDLCRKLEAMGYTRFHTITGEGQFSVMGSCIRVYGFGMSYPVAIDFYGDEIETIRSINQENGLMGNSLPVLLLDAQLITE